jgi:hypothetical protein
MAACGSCAITATGLDAVGLSSGDEISSDFERFSGNAYLARRIQCLGATCRPLKNAT